jgi:hypothetical protein
MNKDYFKKSSSFAKIGYDFDLMTEEETTILKEIVEKMPRLSKYALNYLDKEVKYHYFTQPDMYHVDIDDDEAIRRRQSAGEIQTTFVGPETLAREKSNWLKKLGNTVKNSRRRTMTNY